MERSNLSIPPLTPKIQSKETLARTISHLLHDKRSLRTCRLVCRTWSHLAAAYLFYTATVNIRAEADVEAYLTHYTPTIIQHIRVLKIRNFSVEAPEKEPEGWWAQMKLTDDGLRTLKIILCHLGRYMARLDAMYFLYLDFESGDSDLVTLFSILAAQCAPASLAFHLCKGAMRGFVEVINACASSLRSLTWRDCAFFPIDIETFVEEEAFFSPPLAPALVLDHLCITTCFSRPVLWRRPIDKFPFIYLERHPHVWKRLRSAEMTDRHNKILDLLFHSYHTLEEVHVHQCIHDAESKLLTTDLSSFTRLRTLTLSACGPFLLPFITKVIKLVLRSPLSSLHIIAHVPSTQTPSDLLATWRSEPKFQSDWAQFQNVLVKTRGLRDLRTLTFTFRGVPYGRKLVKKGEARLVLAQLREWLPISAVRHRLAVRVVAVAEG